MRILNVVLNGAIDDGRVMKTARSAADRGWTVRVVGFSKTREPENHQVGPVEVVLALNVRWKIEAEGYWERDPEKRDMETFVVAAAEMFLEHALEFAPDLIHTHDMFGLGTGAYLMRCMAKAGQYPAWVHDAHEYTRGSTNIAENLRRQAMDQHARFIREPDALLTVSPIIADYLVAEDNLVARPSVVLNAPRLQIDNAEAPNDIRSALGLSADVPLVVYSGSIASKARGVETLIEALPLMPDVHVALVCNRPASFETLLNRALELGCADRLHEHPYVPIEQITSFLRSATIGCHPMQHYGNGEVALPNKLFEYIHARVPILVSDVEAMKCFVRENGLGEIFEAENPKALADAVRSMLPRLGDYRSRMTDEFIARYSWETQEKELFAVYDRITGAYDPRKGDLRVMHGVTSAAGQPFATASALRLLGVRADAVRLFAEKTQGRFRSHFVFDFGGRPDRFAVFARLAARYDVFHFYARSFFDVRPSHAAPSLQDLYALKAAGKRIVFNMRGSEARIPSVFRESTPHHWLPDEPSAQEMEDEGTQRLFLDVIEGVSDRIVVTDPELLTYVPQAQVIARAIDLSAWPVVALPRTPGISVLHAPTNRLIKGTDAVVDAVETLRREGLDIVLVLAEQMPQNELRAAIHAADIVVDQLRIGWYGVLAVEAMASGRPVVTYIRDDLRTHLPDDLPLANATQYTLVETLRELAASLEQREALAARGRAYAETVHSAVRVASEYRALYDDVSAQCTDANLASYARLVVHQQRLSAANVPLGAADVPVFKRTLFYQRLKSFRAAWRKQGARKTLRIYGNRIIWGRIKR